jgi:adenylyl- and sulfurtransferase ThiI
MAVLVRYDEIGIKGKNRSRFENVLVRNIEENLRANNVKFDKVRRAYGRIIVETDEKCISLKTVFGISSFSHAIAVGKTIEDAFESAKKLFRISEKDSFRISCQRLDKTFPLKSREVCIKLGEMLRLATNAKVKMKNPDVEISIEIINGAIFMITDRFDGSCGMPVSSQGIAVALIEDDDSVTAALMVMKRGCKVIPAVINKPDISLMQKFSFEDVVPWKIKSINELEEICKKQKANAIVVNDSFGNTRELLTERVVLRPLSGFSSQEIKNERKHFEMLASAA